MSRDDPVGERLAALFASVLEVVEAGQPLAQRHADEWREEARRLKTLALRAIAQAALEAEARGIDPEDFTRVLVGRIERATAHAEEEAKGA